MGPSGRPRHRRTPAILHDPLGVHKPHFGIRLPEQIGRGGHKIAQPFVITAQNLGRQFRFLQRLHAPADLFGAGCTFHDRMIWHGRGQHPA